MQNRTPVARDQRPPLPEFAPVPRRKVRHDGWTPDRQRAFIEALADTGSVSTACRMVNMAPVGAYQLRRQPGAESFRRAWEAALDMGVLRLKDEAFERAINGQLVPVFVAGRLMGFRRKRNDRLLMFCLRHYGQDARGQRVTINYFSNTAHAAAAAAPTTATAPTAALPPWSGEAPPARLPAPGPAAAAVLAALAGAPALAPPSDPAATASDRDGDAAAIVAGFQGVTLDEEAQAAILAALEACAARTAALDPADDPEIPFVPAEETSGFAGELEIGAEDEEFIPFTPDERPWRTLHDHAHHAEIDAAVEAMKAAMARKREGGGGDE